MKTEDEGESGHATRMDTAKEVARDLTKGVLVELEGDDVRAALLRFAIAYRERALGAQGIATFRTVVPEIPRFRALARSKVGSDSRPRSA